jgi:3-hydroxyisobutyrate dehydrogenase
MQIAVIGLGEAGGRYAAALVQAGHQVRGTDPADNPTPAGVARVATIADAVPDARAVFVMTGAAAAPQIARAAASSLQPDVCYADFTSSAPTVMEVLAAEIHTAGGQFADVAILGPVPFHGARTPLMVSGPGAPVVAELMRPIGADVRVLDEPAGAAMAHKLLRSVFMKSLAAVIWEAVEAGRSAGYEHWIRAQIANQLAGDGQAVIDRLLIGTRKHATRRMHEMHATSAYLADLGVPSEMTDAATSALERMAAKNSGKDGTEQR